MSSISPSVNSRNVQYCIASSHSSRWKSFGGWTWRMWLQNPAMPCRKPRLNLAVEVLRPHTGHLSSTQTPSFLRTTHDGSFLAVSMSGGSGMFAGLERTARLSELLSRNEYPLHSTMSMGRSSSVQDLILRISHAGTVLKVQTLAIFSTLTSSSSPGCASWMWARKPCGPLRKVWYFNRAFPPHLKHLRSTQSFPLNVMVCAWGRRLQRE